MGLSSEHSFHRVFFARARLTDQYLHRCIDINSAVLLKRPQRRKLEALESWRSSILFDDRERIVLDYAEAVTRAELRVHLRTPHSLGNLCDVVRSAAEASRCRSLAARRRVPH